MCKLKQSDTHFFFRKTEYSFFHCDSSYVSKILKTGFSLDYAQNISSYLAENKTCVCLEAQITITWEINYIICDILTKLKGINVSHGRTKEILSVATGAICVVTTGI